MLPIRAELLYADGLADGQTHGRTQGRRIGQTDG